ncbi:MAG: GntR family transcriptional regulator [Dethiobacter sp.]|nr:GntR family transcriptional regulator [Dethiobacter sp.]
MTSETRVLSLDRKSAPLHVQLAEALRAELRETGWPAGTPLPSESALCKRFGVARSVVRQALATLVSEGRIVREAGRPAMVAAPREHHRMVQSSVGLYEQLACGGVRLDSRLLRCAVEAPPPEVEAFFGTRDTLALERLRMVDGEPLAYVRTWLPAARVPGLDARALGGGSLHRLLARRYGLKLGKGRNHIRAVAADGVLAEALQVPPGSPLLMLEGHGLDHGGQPLEWFVTWHRSDRLVFDVDVVDGGETVSPRLDGADDGAVGETDGPRATLARAERLAAERALVPDPARPPVQGHAAGRHQRHRGGQRLAGPAPGAAQCGA